MADKKISQLTALAAANLAPSTDVLAIVDTSATETKKIVAQDLVNGVLNVASAVGIGTASPTSKLHVVGTGTYVATFNNSSDDTRIELQKSGTQYGQISVSTTSLNLVGSQSNTAIKFIVNSGTTTAVTIDSSGNLGLGVTPSAWRTGSSDRAFQIGSRGALYADSGVTTEVSNNVFINSSNQYTYIQTDAASRYQQYQGVHKWLTAGSGTAGNTISFTTTMTLDASGNLIGGGKTSASLTAAGFELASDGSLCSTKSSTNTNLATNNGGSLQLANSSATDGNFSNIGAYNSNGLVVSQIDFINVSHASRTGDIAFLTHNGSSLLERARITSGGDFVVGKTSASIGTAGGYVTALGEAVFTVVGGPGLYVNRLTDDGDLVRFYQDTTQEGTISVSGNTVSYNAFAGSHWSQLQDGSKPDILRGTVMESINELCVWPDENNERLPKSKISDTVGSKKVYGVFMAWDNDWTATNDMYVTAVGAFICRVNGSVTVQEGDLLESNGDGTARVQADDIIRSSTIGKVTSTVKTHQYDDGSYCVPTVLYCG